MVSLLRYREDWLIERGITGQRNRERHLLRRHWLCPDQNRGPARSLAKAFAVERKRHESEFPSRNNGNLD